MTPAEAAARYAEAGRAVFPLHWITGGRCSCGDSKCNSPGKHPRTEHGVTDATLDQAVIAAWWRRWPDANIGMRLESLVAVDVDPRNGGVATFDDLVAKYGPLPDTWTARTGGAGSHFVFKAKPGVRYNGRAGQGVDLKHGAGSYIVVEPSNHVSGGAYNWLDETGPLDHSPIANAPEWLGGHTASEQHQNDDDEHIREGGRNAGLTRLAGKLRRAGLTAKEIEAALLQANRERCDPPLSDDEVRAIAKSVSRYDPAQEPAPSELPTRLDLRTLAKTEPTPPAFIVRDWLPQGEVTLYSGHGGSGKSAIALHLAVCIALGRDWLGIPTQRRRVRFVSLEDPADVLHWRLACICTWLGVDMAELADWLSIDDGANADAALMVETREGAALTHVYEWLASTIGDSEVLMLDGASDAFAANENARAHVRAFIRAIRRLIPPTGAALLLAHVNALTARNPETSQGFSGSTAWHNSARSRWYLRPDDDGLILENQKNNYGPTGQSMRLRWNDTAHLFVGELAMPATKLERSLAEADDRETILRLIREAYEAGNPVPAASSGSRTSWHVLATHFAFPDSLKGKDGRRRTLAHIETLRTAGAIRAETVRSGNRNTCEVLHAT